MISFIEGNIEEINIKSIIINCNGIGYEVATPNRILQNLKEGTFSKIYTYLKVREDAQELYGFSDKKDRDAFKILISISGLGPKTALEILEFPSSTIHQALETEDIDFFSRIKGLGKKTASRILLELKGKLIIGEKYSTSLDTTMSDAIEALESLGFERNKIEKILKTAPKMESSEEIIKYGLKNLR